jgi:hypothetical protein
MSKSSVGQLQALIRQLQAERDAHGSAISEIDAAFEELGVGTPAPVKRGRRPGKRGRRGRPGRPKKAVAARRAGKRRKRGVFSMTANELVTKTIKGAGAKGATGVQINKAWKAAGRPGDAYNTLGALTKAKQLRREKVAGGQGSRYMLV